MPEQAARRQEDSKSQLEGEGGVRPDTFPLSSLKGIVAIEKHEQQFAWTFFFLPFKIGTVFIGDRNYKGGSQ